VTLSRLAFDREGSFLYNPAILATFAKRTIFLCRLYLTLKKVAEPLSKVDLPGTLVCKGMDVWAHHPQGFLWAVSKTLRDRWSR
jgi:hypothetical protein